VFGLALLDLTLGKVQTILTDMVLQLKEVGLTIYPLVETHQRASSNAQEFARRLEASSRSENLRVRGTRICSSLPNENPMTLRWSVVGDQVVPHSRAPC
jgi:hypothetical protein